MTPAEDDDKTHLFTASAGHGVPVAEAPNFDATVLPNEATELANGRPPPAFQQIARHPAIGDLLKDRFELIQSLGEGGMGMVFKAVDRRKVEARSKNPYVAIKVLNPALALNEMLVAGLQRECEKAQELSHPNIITVYDFDRDGDHVFMSMEYLAGRSLSQLIRDASASGGVALKRAWPLILSMGEALAYAHRKGIVHSDFKPANVFVTEGGDVKVLDFGIATRTKQSGDPDATVFNARVEGGHTPPYASFEMMNGAQADPRDDIYAFGLVVYELLTGRHPYGRKPASTVFIGQQRGEKLAPAPVKGLNRRQWQLLKSTIEILQERRPKALEEWLEQFDPEAGWSPQLVGGSVAIALVLAGGLANWWLTRQSPEPLPASDAQRWQIAAPPQVAAPPSADAGADRQATVGDSVKLDASASRSGDGQPLTYTWKLAQMPDGSAVSLQNADTAHPELTPDKAGDYRVELTVMDGHTRSAVDVVEVRAEAVKAAEPKHQAASADGVLSLASSKPLYRIGEELKLTLYTAKSGYLRVAYIGATGEISELLPNQYQNGKVKADTEYRIPPRPDKFKLEITGPVGTDNIVAVFSEQALPNVESIANSDGSLVPAMQVPGITWVRIQYEVAKRK